MFIKEGTTIFKVNVSLIFLNKGSVIMPNALSKILNLFKYTRPINNEGGIELLEDKYEKDKTVKVDSTEYEKIQKQYEQKDNKQTKVSQIIKPVKVEQWTREKNSN